MKNCSDLAERYAAGSAVDPAADVPEWVEQAAEAMTDAEWAARYDYTEPREWSS